MLDHSYRISYVLRQNDSCFDFQVKRNLLNEIKENDYKCIRWQQCLNGKYNIAHNLRHPLPQTAFFIQTNDTEALLDWYE